MKNEQDEVDRKLCRRKSLKDKKRHREERDNDRIKLPEKGRKNHRTIRFDDDDEYDARYEFFN